MKTAGGSRGRLLVLALVCGGLMLARPTRANEQDKAAARQLYDEATRYYDLNDYARALTLFRQAYLKYEEPVFLYNIGQCQRQLGDKPGAVKSYRSYLRKAPNAPNRPAVEGLIARLEAAIAEETSAQKSPPTGPLRPDGATAAAPNLTPSAAPAASSVSLTARPTPPPKPLYKHAWFWGVVGGAAAIVATGVALGVVFGQPHDPPSPSIGVVR